MNDLVSLNPNQTPAIMADYKKIALKYLSELSMRSPNMLTVEELPIAYDNIAFSRNN